MGASLLGGGDAQAQEDSAQTVQDVPGAPGVQVDTSKVAMPSYLTARGAPQVIAGTPYLIQVDRTSPGHPRMVILGRLIERSGDLPNPENYGRSAGMRDPATSGPDQMDSGEGLDRTRHPTTPPLAFLGPLAGSLIVGRLGSRYMAARSLQPLYGRMAGGAIGGAVGGLAAGALTDAPDAANLAGIGALLGPFASAAEGQITPRLARLGENLPRNLLLRRPLAPSLQAPINPPRFSGALDEPALDAEMRASMRQRESATLQAARRRGPTMDPAERMAIVDGERGSWPNRLRILGRERLQYFARRAGLSADGTVAQLAQRIADATRNNPELLARLRDLWPFLGIGVGVGIAASHGTDAANASTQRRGTSPATQSQARRLGSPELQAQP
jgi:uncharacterized protein YidB (DUF937 family)